MGRRRCGPAALWSSDLARARQTAAYVEKETGLTARLDARLREFDVGERTGLTMAEFAEQHPDEHAAWLQDRRAELPGAEETTEVLARTLPAYDEVIAGLAPGETAVVVTHGAALKVSVLALLGWPQQQAAALQGLDNCAVAMVEQDEPGGAPGGWSPGTCDPISSPTSRPASIAVRCRRQRPGAVAQLVAHLHGMQRVRGSSPLSSTGCTRGLAQGVGPRAHFGPVRRRSWCGASSLGISSPPIGVLRSPRIS